jgi:hypothetical protein
MEQKKQRDKEALAQQRKEEKLRQERLGRSQQISQDSRNAGIGPVRLAEDNNCENELAIEESRVQAHVANAGNVELGAIAYDPHRMNRVPSQMESAGDEEYYDDDEDENIDEKMQLGDSKNARK